MKTLLLLVAIFTGASGLLRAGQADAEGYKPVVQVTPLLRTSTTAAGQPIAYPRTDAPEVTAVLVEIPPGAETGWHKHPFPCYAYMLSGELTVETEGGRTHHLVAGQALIEAVNVLHNGRNTGSEPVRLVLFVTGEKGKPFTVRTPAPK
ncbi:MAG: cupin domain-containing protein [Terrimicrobiaceae bacterium]|nr:cupin domain-containing protein [Terrimicrobiaceae bacterium]